MKDYAHKTKMISFRVWLKMRLNMRQIINGRNTRRFLLSVFCLSGWFTVVCAQTYYYERTAIVEDGVRKSSSGDGHFITFSKGSDGKGTCYDSDKNGYSENNGTLRHEATARGVMSYYGNSYFGKAHYYFSTDYATLNIVSDNGGKTYVYAKKTAPAGVTKSSRSKENASSSSNGPVYVPSVNSSTMGSTKEQCSNCFGRGHLDEQIEYYPVSLVVRVTDCYRWCSQCGRSDYPHRHVTPRCEVCKGKGYVTY